MMDVSATTWMQLSKLLDEALDLEEGNARAAWLEHLSTTHPELAPALRKLLTAHGASETADVLRRLPALSAETLAPEHTGELAPGQRIGPYRLLRSLGAGGMADVWLAERADGAFARSVALKLPRVNRLRRDLAARFARERDILARLEHPHIARLYDAGIDAGGLPYLAMEYVDGTPITAYCDRGRLDIAARLRLYAQVLEAVQYAHANLVIHRDLKPSNILVTADGQVRLLDFGIAKLLAGDAAQETQLTQLAGRALTPDYASPEQIKGEPLTTATDVYSLGVVLFELLAGTRPYRLKLQSAAQLEEAIVTAEPARPSSSVDRASADARSTSAGKLARALGGDLDTIVLKALKKAPRERYESVAGFADDLANHLRGRPVRARPDSVLYRAEKFVLRHKLETGIAAAVIVALVGGAYAQVAVAAALAVGSGVALWQARVARRQAATAQQERAQALAAADAARKAETRALAVQQFMSELFQANALEQENPAATRQLTAEQLLDRGARQLETSMRDAPEVRVALWSLFGRLYDDLDLHERSIAMRKRAADEVREIFGADSLELGQALAQYASAMRFRRDDRSLALGLLADAHRILARRAPQSAEYAQLLLVETLWIREHDPARAVALCSEAVRIHRAADADAALADALLYLGWSCNVLGRFADAGRALEEARTKLTQAGGPRTASLAIAWRGLGEALAGQLRFDEAAAALATAIEIQLATHTQHEAHSPDGRYLRAQCLLALGHVEAAEAERTAIAGFVCPPGVPFVAAMNRIRLALLQVARGDARAVLAVRDDLPALATEAAGGALAAWVAVIRCHLHGGDLAAAQRAADAAHAIVSDRGAAAIRAAELAAADAELLARQGRMADALRVLDRAQARDQVDPGVSAVTLELDLGKARAFAAAADWPGVCAALKRWIEFQPQAGVQVPLAAEGEIFLLAGTAEAAQGRPARAHVQRALAAFERIDLPHSARRTHARQLLESTPR